MREMSKGRWHDDDRRRRRRRRRKHRITAAAVATVAAAAALGASPSAAFLHHHHPAGRMRSRGRTGCGHGQRPTGAPIVAFGGGVGSRLASPAAAAGVRMSSGREDAGAATSTSTTGDGGGGGYYRPFASYAWDRLISSGLVDDDCDSSSDPPSSTMIPPELRRNSVPAMGPGYPDGSETSIEIRALRGKDEAEGPRSGGDGADGTTEGVVRLARYALLETLAPSGDAASDGGRGVALAGIHVLNLVIFPSVPRHDLPVFGADLVSLPGDRHLIAIDFQPVRPPPGKRQKQKDENDDEQADGEEKEKATAVTTTVKCAFLKEEVEKYEAEPAVEGEGEGEEEGEDGGDGLNLSPVHRRRLEELHAKYLPDMPWGGDIPPEARRFFSPFALWTRFGGGGASGGGAQDGEETQQSTREKIETTVFRAFGDYLDLYVDVLLDASSGASGASAAADGDDDDVVEDAVGLIEGEAAYLEYRRANDPARPMLTRLYGEEFAEELISKVLFPSNNASPDGKGGE